jgi:hypothetical protein
MRHSVQLGRAFQMGSTIPYYNFSRVRLTSSPESAGKTSRAFCQFLFARQERVSTLRGRFFKK